jgi:hypothetical protein
MQKNKRYTVEPDAVYTTSQFSSYTDTPVEKYLIVRTCRIPNGLEPVCRLVRQTLYDERELRNSTAVSIKLLLSSVVNCSS